jgi:hypothetical protein
MRGQTSRVFLLQPLVIILLLGWNFQAKGLTWEVNQAERNAARSSTKGGFIDTGTETSRIQASDVDFLAEGDDLRVIVGRAMLNGQSPVAHLSEGATGELTFQFIDPGTGSPVAGPEVGFVLYRVNLDPDLPDLFTQVGFATDSAENFSLPFVVTGFEPLILATPFDRSGNPVFIPGAGGSNVAVGSVVDIPIPEPSMLLLFSLSLLVPVSFVWRGQGQVA